MSAFPSTRAISRDDLVGWLRAAMRFIDLCDADAAGYDDLHDDAERLTLKGYALFGIDVDTSPDVCLADLEHLSLNVEGGSVISALREASIEMLPATSAAQLLEFRNNQIAAIARVFGSGSEQAKETNHYLTAIRERLQRTYALNPRDERLREQISDEVDWIDSVLKQLTGSERPEGKR